MGARNAEPVHQPGGVDSQLLHGDWFVRRFALAGAPVVESDTIVPGGVGIDLSVPAGVVQTRAHDQQQRRPIAASLIIEFDVVRKCLIRYRSTIYIALQGEYSRTGIIGLTGSCPVEISLAVQFSR